MPKELNLNKDFFDDLYTLLTHYGFKNVDKSGICVNMEGSRGYELNGIRTDAWSISFEVKMSVIDQAQELEALKSKVWP